MAEVDHTILHSVGGIIVLPFCCLKTAGIFVGTDIDPIQLTVICQFPTGFHGTLGAINTEPSGVAVQEHAMDGLNNAAVFQRHHLDAEGAALAAISQATLVLCTLNSDDAYRP